jgi:hypothetical protein
LPDPPPEALAHGTARSWYTGAYLTDREFERVKILSKVDFPQTTNDANELRIIEENIRTMNQLVIYYSLFDLDSNGKLTSRRLQYEDFGCIKHNVVESTVDPKVLNNQIQTLNTDYVKGLDLESFPGVEYTFFEVVERDFPVPRSYASLDRSTELTGRNVYVSKKFIKAVLERTSKRGPQSGQELGDSGLYWAEAQFGGKTILEPHLGKWSKHYCEKSVLALPVRYMQFIITRATRQPEQRLEIIKRALEIRTCQDASQRAQKRSSFFTWLHQEFGS